MSSFADNAEEYRCCCELCHVRTGTTLVGVTHSLFLLFFTANSLVLITSAGDSVSGIRG